MPFDREREVLSNYIRNKNMKQSDQRQQILEIFLKTERHLTAEELYLMVKEKIPSIGSATIYRTLKLLVEAGLCRELRVENGLTRYEHLYGHEHHDHLICTKCGKFVEIVSPDIEALQEKIAKKNGFFLERHRLELYGICRACRN
jgi:Fur family ferric uptake transcriptional regulator